MNLSILDKKCTLDYLDELVPLQRKLLGHILDGKVLTIDSQIETIQHTMEYVAQSKEAYDYDSILKVMEHWVNSGKGNTRLDRFQKELKESFVV